jgi:UDP-glucuronate 4-epimerase
MKILITGVAGFIGFHLSKKLIESGNEVFGIDNLNDYYDVKYKIQRLGILGINYIENSELIIKSSKYKNLYFNKLDINENDKIISLFKSYNPDLVIHLAAQAGVRYSLTNPDEYIKNNIVGFYNVINAARLNNIRNFFYASSSSVYGDSSKLPFNEEDNADKPVSLYAASKKTNELIAHTFSSLYEIRTVGLRFFTVYGPYGRPDMAYFDFTNSILKNKTIKVYNNGNLTRDFTYVDDIVFSIDLLIKKYNSEPISLGSKYNIYNIGNSNPVQLIDFIKTIEGCVGQKAILDFVDMQKGDVHNTYSDSTKLFSAINFQPQTDLKAGVSEFVKWFKEIH